MQKIRQFLFAGVFLGKSYPCEPICRKRRITDFGLKKMKVLKYINKALLILVVFSMASACTTQKKKSDMSALGELYHNTTAHYNGYFNADELVTASILTLDQQHEDNYTKLLPMYEYVAAENPQAVAPDLDEAIKTATQMIEPAMIVFMGLTIGGIAIALLLPIFTVANTMAK